MQNLLHTLQHHTCNDPDCEIHNPEVIEDDAQRLTAKAWFVAGAYALISLMDDVEGDEDNPDPTTEYIQSVAILELIDAHNLGEGT